MQMYMPYHSPPQPIATTFAQSDVKRTGLSEIARFARRSTFTIITTALIFAVLAGAYLALFPPLYRASALVMVERRQMPYFFNEPNFAAEPVTDQTRVASQIEVIRSGQIAAAVVRNLRLDQRPEFSPHPWRIWTWLGVQGQVEKAEDWLKQWTPTEASRTDTESDFAQEVFAKNLSVKRMGQSLVIEVAFRSDKPDLSAEIVNGVLTAYREADVKSKSLAASQSKQWLTNRLNELQQQAMSARLAVEQFKRASFRTDSGFSQSQLAMLQSVSESRQQMYSTFLKKFNEEAVKVSFPEPDSRVVANAVAPLRRTPSPTLILCFAGLLGAAAGGGLSLARASSDRRVRSPNHITREACVDCFGTVSQMPSRYRRRLALWPTRSRNEALSNLDTSRLSPMLRMVVDRPSASLSRDLRAVRTFVNNAAPRTGPLTVGIVAPRKGLGSTTMASNLALLYAMSGERTLLIDACVEDPVLSRAYTGFAKVGFMEALSNPDVLDNQADSAANDSFAVLPAGTGRALATPSDLIPSRNTADQFTRLKSKFGAVIFDLPAISDSADALAVAPFLDVILMVINKDVVSINEVTDCARSLNNGGNAVLGVVINKWAGRADD